MGNKRDLYILSGFQVHLIKMPYINLLVNLLFKCRYNGIHGGTESSVGEREIIITIKG